MHSSDLFERILARFTTPEQAAAIVGDNLETSKASKVPFWLTMSGIVIALAWRRPAAWLASFAAGLTMLKLIKVLSIMWNNVQPVVSPPYFPRNLTTPVALFMSFVAPYAVLRFGRDDRYAKLCAAMFFAAFVGVLLQPFRAVVIASAAATLAVILLSLFASQWRPAAMALLATMFAGLCGVLVDGPLEGFWYRHHIVEYRWLARHSVWGFNLNPLVVPLVLGIIMTTVLSTSSSIMHNWAARRGDPATPLQISD